MVRRMHLPKRNLKVEVSNFARSIMLVLRGPILLPRNRFLIALVQKQREIRNSMVDQYILSLLQISQKQHMIVI